MTVVTIQGFSTVTPKGYGADPVPLKVVDNGDGTYSLPVYSQGSASGILPVTQGTLTDRSGSISSGGAAQTVMAANTSRRYLLFQNVSDTTMWIDFGTDAVADQPSVKVLTNGSVIFEGSFVPTQSVSVICASGSKSYTAKEG